MQSFFQKSFLHGLTTFMVSGKKMQKPNFFSLTQMQKTQSFFFVKNLLTSC